MKKILVLLSTLLTVVVMSCSQPIDDVSYNKPSNIDTNNNDDGGNKDSDKQDNIKKWELIDESGLFGNKEYDSKDDIIDKIKNYISFDYNDKVSDLSEKLKSSEYINFFIKNKCLRYEFDKKNDYGYLSYNDTSSRTFYTLRKLNIDNKNIGSEQYINMDYYEIKLTSKEDEPKLFLKLEFVTDTYYNSNNTFIKCFITSYNVKIDEKSNTVYIVLDTDNSTKAQLSK